MVKLINCFIVSLFLILTSLFIIPQHTLASTTLYFGSIEKTYDDTGAVVDEKVYIPAGNSTAVKTTNYNLTPNTYNLSFLHSDHIGSTVLVTDSQGNKTEEYVYYPYGDVSVSTSYLAGSDPARSSDRLYTGQRKDSSTNLYFYNARYYNPTIGRFLSADKAQGPNRYAYVGNNPVMRNDPSGNEPIIQASGVYGGTMGFGVGSGGINYLPDDYISRDEQIASAVMFGGIFAGGLTIGAGIAAAPEIIASGSLIGTTLAERVGAKSREIKEIIQAAKLPNIPKPDWGMAYARAATAVEKTGIRIYEGDLEFTGGKLGRINKDRSIIHILKDLHPKDKLTTLHHEFVGHQLYSQTSITSATTLVAEEMHALAQTAQQSFNPYFSFQATRLLAAASQLGPDTNSILKLFGY